MLHDDALAPAHIILGRGVTGGLDGDEPAVEVRGAVPVAVPVTVGHQESGMVFHPCLRGGELAELLVRAVVVMDTVRKAVGQPLPVGLNAEVVEPGLCQAALAPVAFKGHLGEDDGSWDAVFLLLAHGRRGVGTEELVGSVDALVVEMEGGDALELDIPYVGEEVVGVFKPPPQPAGDMEVRPCGASGGATDAHGVSGVDPFPFPYPYTGEVAVADGVVTVAHDDVVAGGGIVADIHDMAVEHGQHILVACLQVQAAMLLGLASERILADAERGVDLDALQGKADAKVLVYPVILHPVIRGLALP